MITFGVNDMTCGHCVSSITKAVHAVDQGAQVRIDLAAHRVDITPTVADADMFGAAIKAAGYTPVERASDVGSAPAEAPQGRKGCCCG
ncbi:MAG: heavy-metal-associated domain-containing protein [Betaproteobacteria bacterium]